MTETSLQSNGPVLRSARKALQQDDSKRSCTLAECPSNTDEATIEHEYRTPAERAQPRRRAKTNACRGIAATAANEAKQEKNPFKIIGIVHTPPANRQEIPLVQRQPGKPRAKRTLPTTAAEVKAHEQQKKLAQEADDKRRYDKVEARITVQVLHKAGYSQSLCAKRAGVSQATASRWIKRPNGVALKAKGRPRVVNKEVEQYIRDNCLGRRYSSLIEVQKALRDKGHTLSTGTLHNWMHDNGINWRQCHRKPKLSEKNRLKRMLERAKGPDGNKPILATDESMFCLHPRANRRTTGVWVEKGGDVPTIETVGHSVKLMTWGLIGPKGPGPLVFCKGTMRTPGYIATLRAALPDIKKTYGEEFTLQQDGAQCHVDPKTSRYLAREKIDFYSCGRSGDYPAQSPDMNPIEHVWSWMKNQLVKMKCETLKELQAELTRLWNSIPQQLIDNLYASMPRRWEEVIANNGGWTSY